MILGAGESGAGAAVLAKKEGFDVFVSDMSAIKDKYKQMLDSHGIVWEEGRHTEEKVLRADEIIKSPGIPSDAPMVLKAVERGIHIISEIEFAGRYTRSKMICITGSNGKTSTKDCIAAVLGEKYRVIKTQANFNNEIGLPKTLLTIREDTEMAVVEMGMRGLGQIRAMKHIAVPDAAVITNVGDTHLELLGSLENIAKAKSEILEDFTPQNHAFLNGDDPRVSVMKTGATVHTYGIDSDADVKAVEISADGLATRFVYRSRITGNTQEVKLPLLGRHNVMNALAAVAVGEVYGVPDEAIARGLENLKMTGMRQEILHFGPVTVINDAYNASPASMEVALQTLRDVVKNQGKGRAVAVLADMLELGAHSQSGHTQVGEWCGKYGVEELICYGPESRYTAEAAEKAGVPVHYVENKEAAAPALANLVRPDDVVLLKGSHGMEVFSLIDTVFRKGAKTC